MKTIINVFKNLKDIESKPKRFLLGFSTIVFGFENVLNITFICICFSFIFNFDLIEMITQAFGTKVSDVLVLFLEPGILFFPFLGIVSIIMSICNFFVLKLNVDKPNKTKSIVFVLLLTFLNPILYSFVYFVIVAFLFLEPQF